jgi:hypothetical protein
MPISSVGQSWGETMMRREKAIYLANMLERVADDFVRMAEQIRDKGRADLLGELKPPLNYVSIIAQAAIYDDLQRNGEL